MRIIHSLNLAKARCRITKDVLETVDRIVSSTTNVKLLSALWTLGRYDAIWVTQAPDKSVFELFLKLGDYAKRRLSEQRLCQRRPFSSPLVSRRGRG